MRISIILLLLAFSLPVAAQDNLTNMPDPDPESQLASFRVKEGFEVNLFASDPDIDPPIQMAWDEKGQLWLATSTSYPQPLPGQKINDKIFVLKDTDGDGEADQSRLFADGLLTPTGILPGDGGVYVVNSTELLHFKDTDGDGRADEKQVVLATFGADDTHHLLHSLRWGNDGKMYMNQSVYTYSHVETPWGVKRLRGGGIWRFDTETLELEVFSRGLWNSWGFEEDRWGQSFASDGAGFQGLHFMFPDVAYNPAVGVERVLQGLSMNDPKYSGLAVISGRHFPESMAGDLITNDYRANRVKHFVVEEDSSGYDVVEQEDLIWSDHYAFRPVDVSVGPDGALYLADWYNPIIQHGEVDFRDPRRDHRHGRIWRVTATGRSTVTPPDLSTASMQELLEALTVPEAWTRSQVKRLLREKGADAVKPALDAWVRGLGRGSDDTHAKVEALWTYQSLRLVEPGLLADVLGNEDFRARSAAVRVLYYWNEEVPDAMRHLEKAVNDPHPQVRREAVHALSQLSAPGAVNVALQVLDHPVDEYIEYALWNTVRMIAPQWLPEFERDREFLGKDLNKVVYALRVVEAPVAVAALTALYQEGTIPEREVGPVLEVIAEQGDADELAVLFDMALEEGWENESVVNHHLDVLLTASNDRDQRPGGALDRIDAFIDEGSAESRAKAVRLAGLWEIGSLRSRIEEIAMDEAENESLRIAAMDAIVAFGDETGEAFMERMVSEASPYEMRIEAASRLVRMNMDRAVDPALTLIQDAPSGTDPWPVFGSFVNQENGRTVLAGALANYELSAAIAQAGFDRAGGRGDDALALREAFKAQGAVEEVPRMNLDPSWYELQRLEHDSKAQGNVEKGKEIYDRPSMQCVVCHAIDGEGGNVGPDLSSIGVQAPPDYLIESLLKPEAALKDGYALVRVVRQDGSVMVGLLAGESTTELQLKDASGATNNIPLSQIRERSIIPGSLMPAGLMAQLERDEFLDLLAFLMSLGKEEQ